MRIAATFTPLGKHLPDAKTGALALSILAAGGAAHASPITFSDLQDNDPTALSLTGQAGTVFLADTTLFGEANELTILGGGTMDRILTIDTKPDWDSVLPGSTFSDMFKSEFSDNIAAIQAAAAHRRERIAETLQTTQEGGEGIVFATFEPLGVESGQTPLTFTHVSNAVGILEQEVAGEEMKRSVTAHVGIDTAGSIFEQVTQDPRGIHQVGELVTTADKDIRISENARVAALFTQEKGGIEELQIGVGYDMQPNENIEIILRDANGAVVTTIDANDFQVIPENDIQDAETRDYLVLLIKDDAEALAAIYDNMQAGGTFNVEAFSPMGRKGLSEFTFGETFAQDLDQGYAALSTPGFAFDADTAFKRRIAFDPNAEPINHNVEECVILGLDQLSDADLEDIRVVLGEVTDGTGTLTRNFIAKVALDGDNNVVAFGSEAMWGANMETDTLRLSGSIETGFITNGGEVLNGCTDDKITHIIPPSSPHIPRTGTPDQPRTWNGTPTPGISGTPSLLILTDTPTDKWTPTETPPSTVDAPAVGEVLTKGTYGLLAVLIADSILLGGKGRRGTSRVIGNVLGRRREDEFDTPSAAA